MEIGEKYVIEIEEIMENKEGKLAKIKGFESLVMTERGLDKLEKMKRCEDVAEGKSAHTFYPGCIVRSLSMPEPFLVVDKDNRWLSSFSPTRGMVDLYEDEVELIKVEEEALGLYSMLKQFFDDTEV